MAYALAVGDVLEVKLFCTAPAINQVSVNILYYQVQSVAIASATNVEAASWLSTAFSAPMKAILNNNANYFGLTLTRVLPLPRTTQLGVTDGAGAGSRSGDLAPAQLSMVLTKRSTKAGRQFRGRFYIPFPSQSDIETTRLPKAAYVADADTLGATLAATQVVVGGGGDATLIPVIYSKVGGTFTTIANSTGAAKFGTQRRRGEFGRPNAIPPF